MTITDTANHNSFCRYFIGYACRYGRCQGTANYQTRHSIPMRAVKHGDEGCRTHQRDKKAG
jgi:hypothetical protein